MDTEVHESCIVDIMQTCLTAVHGTHLFLEVVRGILIPYKTKSSSKMQMVMKD